MEPLDEPILTVEPTLDSYLTHHSDFHIFTHAARTRYMALAVFTTYLVMFVFFIRFIRTELNGLENMPQFMALLNDPETTRLMFYLLSTGGLLVAGGVLLYFMWNVVDIWGLQVCVNPLELRVQNTLTGPLAARFTGVGSVAIKDIKTIKGGRMVTRVSTGSREVRFSPVDRLDILITTIVGHAPDVTVEE